MTSHRSPPPDVTELKWREPRLAEIRTPKGKLRLTFGPGSGLSRRPGDPPGVVWGVGDRGPNLKIKTAMERWGLDHLAPLRERDGAKVLPLPDFQPCLAELRVGRRRVHLERLLPLEGPDGPLSGRAPAGSAEAAMEPTFDLAGHVLPADPAGVDPEGVAALADGTFWVCEEYGPSLLQVGGDGAVLRRWTPAGHTLAGAEPVLPQAARRRRLNRGFEGLTASGDGVFLYAVFQSAMADAPHESTAIWKLDAQSGALLAEYAYPFDTPESFTADAAAGEVRSKDLKVCDLAWVGPDRILVLERISRSARIYRVDVSAPGRLAKTLVFSTDDHPDVAADLEGVTLLSERELLLVTDNDFGTEGAETRFYRVRFEGAL
ncbi:esterase-like activity of phytase family protein [Phenylobacterium sp.]|uniref:esterase-like activity of phytase family protein n=1 Tax=Phenylobacterium sp. TaxID=1871053 RepID=UPI002EDB7B21